LTEQAAAVKKKTRKGSKTQKVPSKDKSGISTKERVKAVTSEETAVVLAPIQNTTPTTTQTISNLQGQETDGVLESLSVAKARVASKESESRKVSSGTMVCPNNKDPTGDCRFSVCPTCYSENDKSSKRGNSRVKRKRGQVATYYDCASHGDGCCLQVILGALIVESSSSRYKKSHLGGIVPRCVLCRAEIVA
jgi:hypothetical protein